MSNTNPLLTPSENPFEAPKFNEIKTEHFLPAVEASIKEAKENIAKILECNDAPNFENTILALETCSEKLDDVASIFFSLFHAEATEEHQKLAAPISSKSSEFSSDLLLDEKLFARVQAVYQQIDDYKEDIEKTRLIEKTYKSFARNGALLNEKQKGRLREIDQEMAKIGPTYSENVLKETNSFEMLLTKEEEVAGLPESALDAAKMAAKEKGKEGWMVTLQAPSFIPFLTYANDRSLREKVWRAYSARATKGEYDNGPVIKKIVNLRHERAQLLGYKTHANFVLEERMAENPERVHKFLDKLLNACKASAEKELQELKEFKKSFDEKNGRPSGDNPKEIMPWDFSFYSEKLKEEKFSFNEEELRPYFSLTKVVDGVFTHASQLYGVDFKERKDIPVYHEDVRVFEVTKKDGGDFVGLFYTDFFPRSTKKSGAWATHFRGQGFYKGKIVRPQVCIVCNFTKPTEDKPSLITFMEVTTLFHEFGHALHDLLSQCKYQSLSGTSVYWDFVELPSQVNENWAYEKETLDLFAEHYETGEAIPVELTEKIKESSQFQAGYRCLRQVSFAMLDMSWHDVDPTSIDDIFAYEEKIMSKTSVLPRVPGANFSCQFSHIFAGGYSAGYYSYKWAEVLDADAFEAFKEKGLYNKEVADKFRECILEKGGTEPPMELYKRFRGREPDADALLRRDGLL